MYRHLGVGGEFFVNLDYPRAEPHLSDWLYICWLRSEVWG